MSKNIIFVLIHHCYKLLDLNRLSVHDSHSHDQGSSLCPPIPRRVPSFPAPLILCPDDGAAGPSEPSALMHQTTWFHKPEDRNLQYRSISFNGMVYLSSDRLHCYAGGDLQDGFWIGWLDLLHHAHSHNLGLQVIQRYRWPTHTSQFTVTNALRFSVFISLILATAISQSHWHFK
jgi:hypothetical protein